MLSSHGLKRLSISVMTFCPCAGSRGQRSAKTQEKLVREAGVEPTTFGSGGRRSIQLSYSRTRPAISGIGRIQSPDSGIRHRAMCPRNPGGARPSSHDARRRRSTDRFGAYTARIAWNALCPSQARGQANPQAVHGPRCHTGPVLEPKQTIRPASAAARFQVGGAGVRRSGRFDAWASLRADRHGPFRLAQGAEARPPTGPDRLRTPVHGREGQSACRFRRAALRFAVYG